MNTPIVDLVDRAVPAGRLRTGIPGLDELVGGGFPLRRTILLSGDIGTGKTTFGMQFLMEGATRGEPGLLVCVDQKPQHVIDDVRAFRWNLDEAIDRKLITLLGASPCFTAMRGKDGLEARQVASDLANQICRVQAQRLVIDAASSLVPDHAPGAVVEDFLRSLIVALEDNLGCTTLLLTRTMAGAHPSRIGPTAERLTAGVIELKLGRMGGHVGRSLHVRKMRGTPTALTEQPFDIVDGAGLVVRECGTVGYDRMRAI